LSLNSRGLRPSDAGLLMAAGTLTLVPARSLSRRRPLTSLSPTGAFVLGYALMAVGLFGYALGHTLPALLGPTALLSIGNLLLMGRAFAVVSELAPPGAAARYLAVYGSSWGFATVLAPMLGTWLLGAFGSSALWGATAGVCAAMAVAQPWALRRHPAVPAQRKRGRRSSAPLVTSGPARPSSLGRAREGRIKA
jgi:MFS family permease